MALWTDQGFGWMKVAWARAHQPAAAFLCCPGPSLALAPAELRGPGRTIYAINTAYPKVRPDLWMGMDCTGCFDVALWYEPFPKVTRKWRDDTERMRQYPNVFFADLEKKDAARMFTDRDNESKFVWERNTLVFALHFLIWLGHKKIYFVGCDMGGATDYYDERQLTAEQHANNRRLYSAQTRTLRRLAPVAAVNGITLMSCTADSPLNAFLPYLEVGAALRKAESVVPPARPPLHVFDAVEALDAREKGKGNGNQ